MPSITKLEALRIARDECSRRGWPWNEQTSDGGSSVTRCGVVDVKGEIYA